MSTPCSSCCAACVHGGPLELSLTDAYTDLDRFLPAGTIVWALVSGWKCNHKHALDRWHPYPGYSSLGSLLKADDAEAAKLLDFLSLHHFVAATCSFNRQTYTIILRIYLIPHDLPNVQGKLRTRDEASILVPGRRALQCLLPRIMQDHLQWDGLLLDSLAPEPQQFFPEELVRPSRSGSDLWAHLLTG